MAKNSSRRVLGRGLSALIPDADETAAAPASAGTSGEEIVSLPRTAITPNPFQPRREFDDDEIARLAESIDAQGLLQPILVRQSRGESYEIISGERRFRALGVLGRETVPCVMRRRVADREMMEMALVENIQREDLNEMEKADAYQRLIQEHRYTHDALAKQVGKSRAAVSNALRLLNLQPEIQQMLRRNDISMGHARALLAVDDEGRRLSLANRIVTEGLSVRVIEEQSASRAKKRPSNSGTKIDPNLAEVIERLRYKLGTPVKVRGGSNGRGVLEIEYYTESDCARIFDILLASS